MSLNRPKHIIGLAMGLALVVGAASCDDEEPPLYLGFSWPADAGPTDADLPDSPDQDVAPPWMPPAPRSVCEAGAVRCLATATAHIERCVEVDTPGMFEEDAPPPAITRWVSGSCERDEVCIAGECGAFACTPGRLTCDGLNTYGTCNEAGDAVIEGQTCPDSTTCRGGTCVDACEVAAQVRSYIGCDYVVLELPNPLLEESTPNAPFGLVVSNTDPLSTAIISLEAPGGGFEALLGETVVTSVLDDFDATYTVASAIRFADGETLPLTGEAVDVALPPGAVATLLLEHRPIPFRTSGIYDTARRLRSSHPVVAYQFNPYCCNVSFTNDASLLLPTTALGKDYTLLGSADMIFETETEAFGTAMTLVATEDDTTLDVTLPADSILYDSNTDRLTVPETDRDTPTEFTVDLDQGEVLHLESRSFRADRSVLVGARVRASKRVAAYSTNPCANVPQSLVACDHLEQQLIPEDTWGRRYVMSPTSARGTASSEINYWQIAATDRGATLRLSRPLSALNLRVPFATVLPDCRDLRDPGTDDAVINLQPHQHCTLGTKEPFVLEATEPVMVMGFISGQQAAESNRSAVATGDPAMFLLPPIEQYRASYLFLTPETYLFDFATVIILSESAGTLTLDGQPVDLRKESVEVLTVQGTSHLIAHIPITDGAHRLEAETAFGLIVYAYDAYVSYAYPGGMNLTKQP